jgi:hypothetical protein
MTQLTIHPGPRLLRVVYPDGALPQDEDVTDRAVEFLFDRLVLGPDVRLFESDTYSCRSSQQISLVHSRDLSLGDVLQAMLWEMTWFGLPDDTEEVLEEMAELGKPPRGLERRHDARRVHRAFPWQQVSARLSGAVRVDRPFQRGGD